MKSYTYNGTVKIARLDGSDIQDTYVGDTVKAQDESDVEAICHVDTIDTIKKIFPAYKILQLPTLTNGKLNVRIASDYGF